VIRYLQKALLSNKLYHKTPKFTILALLLIKSGKKCFQSLCSNVSNSYLQREMCSHHLCIQMASHLRKCFKEFCTWKNHLLDHQELQGLTAVKKALGHPRVPSKCQDLLLLRDQLQNCVTTSEELLNIGRRWFWVHLHTKKGQEFCKTNWYQEGQQRSHFSPRKTSKMDWNSTGSTVQELDTRRQVQSYSLEWSTLLTVPVCDIWKIDWEGTEKLNATMNFFVFLDFMGIC